MNALPAVGRRHVAVIVLVLVAAVWLAGRRVDSLERSRLGPLVGHVHRGEVTLLRAPRPTRFGGWTALARLGSDPVLLRVEASQALKLPTSSMAEGDILAGLFAVAPADDFARAIRAHGVARGLQVRATGRRRGGAAGVVDSVRREAQAALAHGLPPPLAALLRGMVLGDDSALPETTRDDFRAAGLSHLMAASGQNVVLLAALAIALASAAGLGFRTRWAIVAALIALYVPLAGGGPSIQRAGVMGVLGVIALVSARPQTRWYPLALAAVVTLAYDPRSVTDPGWQMSFAAVVALLALARPWAGRLTRAGVPAPLAEAIAVTAAATLGTAPVIAAHFGTASPVTVAANIAAAPVVAPIMWLGLLAAAIGPVVPVLAAGLDALAGPLLGFLTAVAGVAARTPGAALPVGPMPVAVGCGCIVAIAGRDRVSPRRARAAAIVLAALLSTAAAGAWRAARPIDPPAGLRITFLDVGQGDATLVQDGGAAVLVDTGPPGSPLLARLRHAGVRRLSALVVTHAEADHEGGAAAVLAAMPVGVVLDGRDGVVNPAGESFAGQAAKHDVPLRTPRAGFVLRAGPLALRVLSPGPGPTTGMSGADPNKRAIVLELHDRGARVLLPADAESDVLSGLALSPVDLLKVSHHGSDDPGLLALLDVLRPKAAVIEVGAQNTYGHPTPSTLAALSRRVGTVYRTDRDGTVRADLVDGRWVFHRHSLRRLPPVYPPPPCPSPPGSPRFSSTATTTVAWASGGGACVRSPSRPVARSRPSRATRRRRTQWPTRCAR